jgi:hypothetical protein
MLAEAFSLRGGNYGRGGGWGGGVVERRGLRAAHHRPAEDRACAQRSPCATAWRGRVPSLRAGRLTFPRNTFMFLVRAFDAAFIFLPIVR